MVFCFTEALLTYRTWPLSKQRAKAVHLAFQSLGIILLRSGVNKAGGRSQSHSVCVCVCVCV